MKAVLFSVIGIFLYATQNVVIDQRLRPYSTSAVVLVFYAASLPLVLGTFLQMRLAGKEVVWPAGADLWFAAVAGAVYYFADFFYVGAYAAAGGNVFAVTVCAALLPVFVAMITFAINRILPNSDQVIGIILAAAAVYFVAKGSPSPPPVVLTAAHEAAS